jgi:hypothetical protein
MREAPPVVILLLLAAAACGGGGKVAPPAVIIPPVEEAPPEPAPRPPVRVVFTVVGASIDGRKPDGAAWDDEATPPRPPELRGSLAAYLAAHPELEGTAHLLGEPVDVPGVLRSARASSAPDPMVFVEVGGRVFRTPIAPGQFQPTWRFPLTVTVAPDRAEIARFTVVDWDGPGQLDVIGEQLVPLSTLLAAPITELPRFGNVERLVVEVADAGELATRHRVAVAGRDGWIDAGVDVIAGQGVTIRAAGEVCSKGNDRARCAGPEGQPRPDGGNLPGFEARGHAGLVGGLGDSRFFIGRELRFVASSSGRLLLGVNDADTANNSGELEVLIELR